MYIHIQRLEINTTKERKDNEVVELIQGLISIFAIISMVSAFIVVLLINLLSIILNG